MKDTENIRRLAAAVRENLAKCAGDPDVDPVHDTRTGTRRLQATIENLVRELPEDEAGAAARDAAAATMRALKRIRRAAGPVRDLDVHRKLLGKLTKRAQESPQADDLDAWLKQRRDELAEELKARARGALPKFDKRVAVLEAALQAKGLRRRRAKPAAVVALENFARLATEMQALHAGNLHDFRKGAKKARYVAELAASGDEEASRVGGTLKRLQDEIGDWHDWLVLAEEAHAALGDGELIVLIEAERDRHFAAAMQMAAKLRGRLMGEWLAVGRMRPAASGQRPAASSQQPAASGQQPAASGQRAAASGPAASGQRPAASGQLPAASGQPPAASSQRPAASGQRPAVSGQQPAASSQPPAGQRGRGGR